jgi:hypothetical protein
MQNACGTDEPVDSLSSRAARVFFFVEKLEETNAMIASSSRLDPQILCLWVSTDLVYAFEKKRR